MCDGIRDLPLELGMDGVQFEEQIAKRSWETVTHTLCRNLLWLQVTFSPALSREFRPCKPDPAPLLHICAAWNVQPNEVMMVGDSLKDDVRNLVDIILISVWKTILDRSLFIIIQYKNE